MINNIPKGKGMFIWRLESCSNDDPEQLALDAKSQGFSWVAIKVQNGISKFQPERLPAAIQALKNAGIKVYGWGYLYGADWLGRSQAQREGELTVTLCLEHKLLGFFIDVEKEYKRSKAYLWANTYMKVLYENLTETSKGLCSYRYPSYHPELPWHNFLNYCDFHAPQVYWVGANNPGDQLKRSIRELTLLENLPVAPLGAAYKEGTWQGPTVSQLDEFNAIAKEMNLPGISWWSWQHAEVNQSWWKAIASYDWNESPPTVKKVKLARDTFLRSEPRQVTDTEIALAKAGKEFVHIEDIEGGWTELGVYVGSGSIVGND